MQPFRTAQEEKLWKMYFKQQAVLEQCQAENKRLVAEHTANEQERARLAAQAKALEENYANLYQIYTDKDEALQRVLGGQQTRDNQTIANLQRTIKLQNDRISQLINARDDTNNEQSSAFQTQIEQLQMQLAELAQQNSELKIRCERLGGDLAVSRSRGAYEAQMRASLQESPRSIDQILRESTSDGLAECLAQCLCEAERRREAGDDVVKFDNLIAQVAKAMGFTDPIEQQLKDYQQFEWRQIEVEQVQNRFSLQKKQIDQTFMATLNELNKQTNELVTRFNNFESQYNLRIMRVAQGLDRVVKALLDKRTRDAKKAEQYKQRVQQMGDAEAELQRRLDAVTQSSKQQQRQVLREQKIIQTPQTIEQITNATSLAQKRALNDEYQIKAIKDEATRLQKQQQNVDQIKNLMSSKSHSVSQSQSNSIKQPQKQDYSTDAVIKRQIEKTDRLMQRELENEKTRVGVASPAYIKNNFKQLLSGQSTGRPQSPPIKVDDLVQSLSKSRQTAELRATSGSRPSRYPNSSIIDQIHKQMYQDRTHVLEEREKQRRQQVREQVQRNVEDIQRRQQQRKEQLLQKLQERRSQSGRQMLRSRSNQQGNVPLATPFDNSQHHHDIQQYKQHNVLTSGTVEYIPQQFQQQEFNVQPVNPRKQLLESEQMDAVSDDIQLQIEEQALRQQFEDENQYNEINQQEQFPMVDNEDLVRDHIQDNQQDLINSVIQQQAAEDIFEKAPPVEPVNQIEAEPAFQYEPNVIQQEEEAPIAQVEVLTTPEYNTKPQEDQMPQPEAAPQENPPHLPQSITDEPPVIDAHESSTTSKARKSKRKSKRGVSNTDNEMSATANSDAPPDLPPDDLPMLEESTATEISSVSTTSRKKGKKKRSKQSKENTDSNFSEEPTMPAAAGGLESRSCSNNTNVFVATKVTSVPHGSPMSVESHTVQRNKKLKKELSESSSFVPPTEQRIPNLRRAIIQSHVTNNQQQNYEDTDQFVSPTSPMMKEVITKPHQNIISTPTNNPYVQPRVKVESRIVDDFGNSILSQTPISNLHDDFGNSIRSMSEVQDKVVDEFGNTIMSLTGDSQTLGEKIQNSDRSHQALNQNAAPNKYELSPNQYQFFD